MKDSFYKRLIKVGPGGMSCPCCTDHHHKNGNRHTFYNRLVRKRLKRLLLKEEY